MVGFKLTFSLVSVLVVGLPLQISGQGQSQGQGQGPCQAFQRTLSSARAFDTYFASETQGHSGYPILATLPLAQGNKEVFRVRVTDGSTDEQPFVLVPTNEPVIGDFSEYAAVCKVGNARSVSDLQEVISEFIGQVNTVIYIRNPWVVVLFETMPGVRYDAPEGCVLHYPEVNLGTKFHFQGPKFVLVPPGSTVTLNVDRCLD